MKSRISTFTLLTVLPVLAMMFFLAGCKSALMTHTGEIDDKSYWVKVTKLICEQAWVPQTYSSRDTAQTQLEIRANNAAREAYCNTEKNK